MLRGRLGAALRAIRPGDCITGPLRTDLGYGGPPLARITPALREVLPEIGEPVPLAPNEEQFRILDAAAQFLIASSKRAPLILVLDDLHWADAATVAMLRHVARFCRAERLLLVGAYRDVELDRQHPLSDALAALRREVEYERILLRGLTQDEVGELLEMISEHEAAPEFVEAVSRETDGNPFFVREVLLHLVEDGKLVRQEGRWTSNLSVAEMGIPEGVRQVIGRRLSRLSKAANQFLAAASAFSGPFRFDAAALGAELEERTALDAVDEALESQSIRAASGTDTYEFTHALIRHTLYGEMNPSRQVRLHRRLAEALEQVLGANANESAAEIAYQYHRSAAIPGAEKGVAYALAAADRAEGSAAFDDACRFLRMALELMPEADERRPRTLGRLGVGLAWALDGPAALAAAIEAGDLIAATEGDGAGARYFAEAAASLRAASFEQEGRQLAVQGLHHAGARRDASWAVLTHIDLNRREEEAPDYAGIALPTPERREVWEVLEALAPTADPLFRLLGSAREPPRSRDAALASGNPVHLVLRAGEYGRAVPLLEAVASEYERQGLLAGAVLFWAMHLRANVALGNFDQATSTYVHAKGLAERLAPTSIASFQLGLANLLLEITIGRDSDPAWLRERVSWRLHVGESLENRWLWAATKAFVARSQAILGEPEEALASLRDALPALERAPGSADNYPILSFRLAETLWVLNRQEHLESIKRNICEKVLDPDLRYDMTDARLALARLCSVQGRLDEAREWFAASRKVLDEQGARPLRAIVDFDEAWALVRAAGLPVTDPGFPPAVRAEVESLLAAAQAQFEAIGMPGWIKRVEALRAGRPVIERQQPDSRGGT